MSRCPGFPGFPRPGPVLLGSRYGQRQASGKAATAEEFDEAIRSKPVLVFSQLGVDRDGDMADFVQRVQNWVGGSLTATFSSRSSFATE